MNSVDRADHNRESTMTLRRCLRNWKPLWHWLLDTTLCNAAMIWKAHGHFTTKHGSLNTEFRKQIYLNWMSRGRKPLPVSVPQSIVRTPNKQFPINPAVPTCTNGLLEKASYCVSCVNAGRKAIPQHSRKPLSELSRNSVRSDSSGRKTSRQRPPCPKNGCLRCLVNICKSSICWNDHI